MQHNATHFENVTIAREAYGYVNTLPHLNTSSSPFRTHCNTLQKQCAALCGSVLQYVAEAHLARQRTATPQHLFLAATHYCNTPQHTTAAQHVNTSTPLPRRNTLLQHAATHYCNTLQHATAARHHFFLPPHQPFLKKPLAVVCYSVLQ